MPNARVIDVSEFIDQRRISRFQILIAGVCFLVVAVDGFDATIIGFLAPSIRTEWALTPAQLAPLFGAGLFGLMAGAFVFGPLSDKLGRKTILMFCVLFFGAASLASSYSTSLAILIALRFLTGAGLGGAMPNSLTLTSEYCPEKHRLFLVTTMFCGFAVGSALGGVASAPLIEQYGWRSMLALGGVLPLALLPLIAWQAPESARFLVLANKGRDRIAAALRRISPQDNFDDARFALNRTNPTGARVGRLFKPDLIVGTLMLWLTFFSGLLIIYLLSSWLPTFIKSRGLSLETASIVTSMFQVGGTVGAMLLGSLMDRFNPPYVLAISYALGALFIAAIGALTFSPWLCGAAVFGAGLCISGSQVGVYALAASFYPTVCRATGVGWALGVGRLGSILGAMGGGIMLSTSLSPPIVFVGIGAPALLGAAAMGLLGRNRARRARRAAARSESLDATTLRQALATNELAKPLWSKLSLD